MKVRKREREREHGDDQENGELEREIIYDEEKKGRN
jgi:hypothetical protein